MGATRAGRPAAVLCALWLAPAAVGGEPAPPAAAVRAEATRDRDVTPVAESDLRTARAEAEARLKRLNEAGGGDRKGPAAGGTALRDVLQERLDWLNAWDEAARARHQAEHPEPSPERRAADLKADLALVRDALGQAERAPDCFLPTCFRAPCSQVSDAVRVEMKEAIEAAQNDLNQWAAKLEKLRSDPEQEAAGRLSALRAERDKAHQRVAMLKTRRAEREAAVVFAKTVEASALARERRVNFEWEARAEAERLLALEARLNLEGRVADLTALELQVDEAHALLARKTLERMQERYQAASERAERALKQEAAREETRAARSDDPLERFRARRKAQLLELKAQVVKHEQAVASLTTMMERQANLADRARTDFESIKKLLDDGRLSHLDALRLNNDFRRIGPERTRIIKTELATAANLLTYYENALSGVEIAQINDSRDDRYELEPILEQLPPGRRAEAQRVADELEEEHAQLLERDRIALGALASKAELNHEQIVRRLRVLDDQYGFIRTHLFWVRDQEAVGRKMLRQCEREAAHVGKGLASMVLEAGDRSCWGWVSAEFVLGAAAALVLPWPLLRARKWLNPAHPVGRRPGAPAPA